MIEFTPNYLSILVAAIAQMLIGYIYYAPAVFGKQWMKLKKMDESDMKKEDMGTTLVLSFIASLVTAYVLAHILNVAGAQTVSDALQGGFWIWLGFIATTTLMGVVYGHKPFKLYVLNNGYHLLSLLVMAGILVSLM